MLVKSILFVLVLFAGRAFSQFEEKAPTQQPSGEEPPKCRDARFRLVPDCNGLVYPNEDQGGAMIHKNSGKPFTGSCKVCHINGNIEMFITFQGGWPVGQDTVWYENGVPQLVRSHDVQATGKEDGTWKLYRADGSLKWEKSYVMGAEDGESRYYFPDSSLEKIETWSMGELNGKKQEFYPNNSIKKEIMYSNGEWNGKYITYFKDGMVESEQEFKNGKKQGLSRYYYDNGALFYEENHENGCREGEFRRFYLKDQRIWTIENYKKDRRSGLFEEYYDTEKNTIKYRATYKDGELVEEHFFDEFGEETAPAEKKSPFMTGDEAKEQKDWPENPTDEWLEEKKVTRKQYDKARSNFFKNKKKERQNGRTENGC